MGDNELQTGTFNDKCGVESMCVIFMMHEELYLLAQVDLYSQDENPSESNPDGFQF